MSSQSSIHSYADSLPEQNAGHCFRCGTKLRLNQPANDPRLRLVCPACHYVHYENPKILVGCVVTSANRVLLCQRAIEPARGLWAPPAGFLECNESLESGASREVLEETGVLVDMEALVPHVIMSLLDVRQIYVFFRAVVADRPVCVGPESLAAGFFTRRDVPWNQLAFPNMREHLDLIFDEQERAEFSVHVDRIEGETLTRRGFRLSKVICLSNDIRDWPAGEIEI